MLIGVWKVIPQAGRVDLEAVALPAEAHTLDEASATLPGGAYTTLRTYGGRRALRLDDHFRRLEQTAQLAGQPLRLDDLALRAALRQVTLFAPPRGNVRLRLTLDLQQNPGDIFISAEPLEVPPRLAYQQGVKAVTCGLQRQLPKAKLTRFISRAAPVRQSLPEGINEAIMVDAQGFLLEGLSSNFFAVLQGVIYTAEAGVLSGITRSLVLECIRQAGMPLRLQPVRLDDLPGLQEGWITSASRGVLPVVQIDAVTVGTGQPGGWAQQLMQAYQTCVREQAEPI
jgi:branched-chain amino acid aminotransferase